MSVLSDYNCAILIKTAKGGSIMVKNNLKELVYICPSCLNEIENCTCERYPFTLVQLDRKIWPIIKVLNEKWYFTTNSCEGHIGKTEKIIILFDKSYKIGQALPKGFVYKEGALSATITGTSVHSKKIKKQKLLNSLYVWSCSIESRRPINAPIRLKEF